MTLFLLLIVPLSAQDTESDPMPQYFYTHQQVTGNRFIAGQGTFPNVEVDDLDLPYVPVWVRGYLTPEGDISWRSTDDVAYLQDVSASDDIIRLVGQLADVSPFSNVVPVGAYLVYVARNGDLVLWRDGEVDRQSLAIQPDARIVVNENGQLAVYANATNQRYVHGIMGDDLEGSSLLVLEARDDELGIVTQIDLEGDAVYEGLFPMWADVDRDTTPDLITTVSDSQSGSRIRVYRMTYDGIRVADGQAIGRANRWQHQLAFAPFGINGEMELVEVLTPHIGGVVRFYRFNGNEMEIVAQVGGYTSHVIHSRNLDMAVAGDFNGDGRPEIVLPSQDRQRIVGIQHNENGAEVVWELPLNGTLSSNLAAVQLQNGKLALAAGTEAGHLRLWMSQ
ncbi:MAG: hypothetical protein Q9P44_19760 [Anaerolineae bacterium]|nr:hypothetical protein [Anaerolineae bacterium]